VLDLRHGPLLALVLEQALSLVVQPPVYLYQLWKGLLALLLWLMLTDA
jgi:hypothetical protein